MTTKTEYERGWKWLNTERSDWSFGTDPAHRPITKTIILLVCVDCLYKTAEAWGPAYLGLRIWAATGCHKNMFVDPAGFLWIVSLEECPYAGGSER